MKSFLLGAFLLGSPASADEKSPGKTLGAVRVSAARAMRPQRLTPTAWDPAMTYSRGLDRIGAPVPVIRRSILAREFSEGDRRRLAAAMRDFLTPDVVLAHLCGVSHVAEHLFTHHDRYILQMEMFLAERGLTEFLPLPYWEAGGPIPPEFMQPVGRVAPVNLPSNFYLLIENKPEQLRFPEVCRFGTDQDLADAMEPWHSGVHNTLGGCMSDFSQTSATPLFWLWHAYVSQSREEWKRCPGVKPTAYTDAPAGSLAYKECRAP